jgi:large subunit ribosomal protein L25
MALIKLNLQQRDTKGKNENRRTRAAGFIPAVLYGSERPATSVQVEAHAFHRILQKTGGRSVIFDLQLDGQAEQPIALMRELQRHPVSDEILHVDLFEIPRGMPVTVHVSLELEGEPGCIKYGDGEVLQLLDGVELSCLPRDLPDCIKVDVSELSLNDKLFVKDLTVPVGTVENDPETQVLVVKPVSILIEEETPGEGEEDAAAEDSQKDEKPAE